MIKKLVKNIFKKNKLYYDWWAETDTMIQIVVNDGDWKHDHLRLRKIMKDNGFDYLGRYITDESNGDDTFSAQYIFYYNIDN